MDRATHSPSRGPRTLSREALSARAAYVIRSNDRGTMTTAAPMLYPHMWSWDAAFIAIGLSRVSLPRAIVEMDTLLTAQWRNGMIPHIVFSPVADSYFPGAARWQSSALAPDAPAGTAATTGPRPERSWTGHGHDCSPGTAGWPPPATPSRPGA
jgi:hypothetical protein